MNSFSISSILGNHQFLDGGAMFGNVPRAMWERWETVDSASRILLQCRSFLIEVGSRKILLETGIGCFFSPELAKRYGVDQLEHELILNLSKSNISPEDITDIVLSHLHFDHAGGLLNSYYDIQKNGMQLAFPKARIFVSQKAWERAVKPHPRDKASFIDGMTDLLKNSGRLTILNDESKDFWISHKDLPEGFLFSFSQGHTPGHMHTWIRGKTQSFVFAGDLVPGKSWVHLPITMGYDRYPELVIDEKKKFYDKVLEVNAKLLFTHDSKVASSSLDFDSEKKKFSAKEDISVLSRYEF